MNEYVNNSVASDASKNGALIGKTRPDRETKGSWWEVFVKPDGVIVACVMSNAGIGGGVIVSENDVHMYVDDEKAAKTALDKARVILSRTSI